MALRVCTKRRARALYVVPQVSLVNEMSKAFEQHFQPTFAKHGWGRVQALLPTHMEPGSAFLKGIKLAVCTIERANLVINALISGHQKTLQSISVVVVDELHFLADTSRGHKLEILLAKLKAVAPHVQVGVCVCVCVHEPRQSI
jgi:helicase